MKFWLLLVFFIASQNSFSRIKVKIGLLVPKETNIGHSFYKMTKEIKKKTKGEVHLKFYFGGSQGDEPDVLRKIRVGQLHGGMFTGKTLGEINGDIRLMEIPFTFFNNRKKAYSVLQKMKPHFKKKLAKENFINLSFFEIGMVYFVSLVKASTLNELKGLKTWLWEGDLLSEALIQDLNLIPVPLSLPDVLSSLSTGVIQAAYSPPLGLVALQWHTKIKYIIDFPIAYSIGAFLIDTKTWKKISKKNRKIILKVVGKYRKEINRSNIQDNKEVLERLKSLDVEFVKFDKKQ